MATANFRSNSEVKVSISKAIQTLPLKSPLSVAKLSPTDISHVGKIGQGLRSGSGEAKGVFTTPQRLI